ncbi:hypothetical protein AVDCRST_MAG92-2746 [uncultured Coleofasciculus sp.]|uniref:Uncharacterized protein n=1 Tax=uncultured Coleofasciculus sp. TaxID=1267456 RepID=A0A6J4IZV3_9CYAN|nr:hypothetical protein AVDCRST_MAG92-2746 [uncultured Coleofasciculus sp.]
MKPAQIRQQGLNYVAIAPLNQLCDHASREIREKKTEQRAKGESVKG